MVLTGQQGTLEALRTCDILASKINVERQVTNMKFPEQFEDWLSKSMSQGIPAEVVSYSFNLFEYSSGNYGIEVIGASEFDPDNRDWACEEIWEPDPRMLDIPADFCCSEWETCLRDVRSLLLSVLEKPTPAVARLKNSQGIGIGFVDGDMEIIWQHK